MSAKRKPTGLRGYLCGLVSRLKSSGGMTEESAVRVAVELEELMALRDEAKRLQQEERKARGLLAYDGTGVRKLAKACGGKGSGKVWGP